MSEFLLRVIALPSLVHPYFDLDIEQDKINISLVNQAGIKLNEMNNFAPVLLIPSILE